MHQGNCHGRVSDTMENLKLLAGVIGGTLVLIVGVAFLFSGEGPREESFEVGLVRGEEVHVRSGFEEASGSGDLAESSESAEVLGGVVELVEFSDFECPACAGAQVLLDSLLDKYDNKLALIYRHFPLESIHDSAFVAAVASEVMAKEGLFFEYHDVLFERQDEWTEADDLVGLLASYARELGVDEEVFMAGLESEEYENRVREDMVAGRSLGISATPTFFVNGIKVNTNELESEIEKLL